MATLRVAMNLAPSSRPGRVRALLAGGLLVLLLAALAGCDADAGVAGGEAIDSGGGGGGDVLVGDGQGGSDDAGGVDDGWSGDIWSADGSVDDGWYGTDGIIWQDVEPFGCVSDSQCPSAGPCQKGVCDLSSHQCVSYLAPDYTFCPGAGGLCGLDGYCLAGQCVVKSGLVCDDGNPCTTDSCDPASGGCQFLQIPGCGGCTSDAACSDGNSCTNDYCKGGQCYSVPIPNCGGIGCKSDLECNDANGCTVDKCLLSPGGTGTCTHYGDLNQKGICCDPMMNAITCNDGNPCTYDQCGMNYFCQYPAIPGCGSTGCTSTKDCDDGLPCSIDSCVMDATGMGKCQHVGDLSNPGKCCDPAIDLLSCDDGNYCTADLCGAKFQCEHVAIPGCTMGCTSDKACYDGNACTFDMCVNGACQYGGIACASPDPCQTAACDPKSGQCIYTPIPGCGQFGCKSDQECDDGLFCTLDICAKTSAGTAKCAHKLDPSVPPGLCCDPVSSATQCNDGDACTQDQCGMDYTCQYFGIPGCMNKCKSDADCPGGDVCTIAKCDIASGVCLYGSIPNCCNPAWCEDGDPCTQDSCDPYGGCMWTPIPGCIKPCDPVACNDYNPCTQDGCDAMGNCYNAYIPGCQVQYCKSDMECQDTDMCTKDYCDFASNTCTHIGIPGCGIAFCKSSAECNDFNPCTGDLCLNNQCAHKAVTCDDGNPCTADACSPMDGSCSNYAIPGCVAQACKTSVECEDKNPCTTDVCVSGWCNHNAIAGCFGMP